MSETQRNLFNTRVGGLLIAGAFVLFAVVFVVRFLASDPVRHDPESVKSDTLPAPRREVSPPAVLEVSETYYRTIIDNNLFRPLGWTPPHLVEPYCLIGTVLARDANIPPKAIIESTAGNTTYIVSIGEKIDASTEVVSIESKQVTLSTDGEQRTLHLPIGF